MAAEVKLASQAHPAMGAGFIPSQCDSKAVSSATPRLCMFHVFCGLPEKRNCGTLIPGSRTGKESEFWSTTRFLLDPGSLLPLKSMFTVEQWLHLVLGLFLASDWKLLSFVLAQRNSIHSRPLSQKSLCFWSLGRPPLPLVKLCRRNRWQFSIAHLVN